jgi:Fe2+ transport system protein FeoA
MNFNLSPTGPELSLADLSEGETAVLSALRLPQTTSEHLMWLGFIPGAEVTAGQSAPGGDPRVYTVSGTSFALRRDIARNLLLQGPQGEQA